MKKVIRKFTPPERPVAGSWSDTLAIEKACMLLLKDHSSGGRENEIVCFKNSLLGAVDVFARQILNKELEIVGVPNVQSVAKGPGVCCWWNQSLMEEITIGCPALVVSHKAIICL